MDWQSLVCWYLVSYGLEEKQETTNIEWGWLLSSDVYFFPWETDWELTFRCSSYLVPWRWTFRFRLWMCTGRYNKERTRERMNHRSSRSYHWMNLNSQFHGQTSARYRKGNSTHRRTTAGRQTDLPRECMRGISPWLSNLINARSSVSAARDQPVETTTNSRCCSARDQPSSGDEVTAYRRTRGSI